MNSVRPSVGNLALKKKGLRQNGHPPPRRSTSWKPCPEEKGIKTRAPRTSLAVRRWKPCPEEKGIKTVFSSLLCADGAVGNLALKKKGLRHMVIKFLP